MRRRSRTCSRSTVGACGLNARSPASSFLPTPSAHAAIFRPAFDQHTMAVDGNDWHVAQEILRARYRPRVLIAEVTVLLPLHADMVINYDAKHSWDGTCYVGGSRRSWLTLARAHGYSLVGQVAPDLYFVRDDVLHAAGSPFAHVNNLQRIDEDARYAGNSWDTGSSLDLFRYVPYKEQKLQKVCLQYWQKRGFGNTTTLMPTNGQGEHVRGHEHHPDGHHPLKPHASF